MVSNDRFKVVLVRNITSTLADPGGCHPRVPPPPPPTGSNSFIFAYVFAKKHPRQRLAPPPPNGKSWIRHRSNYRDFCTQRKIFKTIYVFTKVTGIHNTVSSWTSIAGVGYSITQVVVVTTV